MAAARDHAGVDAFVEQFSADLEVAGIPRAPARVLARLMVEDDGHLTAADLAWKLQLSPAAVSGAVKYLTQVQLVRREREPGSRRDRYVVSDQAWYESSLSRQPMLDQWARTLKAGVKALGPRTPAGARMREMNEFIGFMQDELPAMLARWRKRRQP